MSANGKVHHSKHLMRKIASELKALWKNKGKGKNAMSNPEKPAVGTSDIVDAALDMILAFIDGKWETYNVQEGY